MWIAGDVMERVRTCGCQKVVIATPAIRVAFILSMVTEQGSYASPENIRRRAIR